MMRQRADAMDLLPFLRSPSAPGFRAAVTSEIRIREWSLATRVSGFNLH